uniref:Multiple inositol polyphosphate phosphatase 1 n=1 Tax=Glossina austeni TaxID=7395 RepID=A0A1A9URP2_GLOAU
MKFFMVVSALFITLFGHALAQFDYCFGKDTERSQTRQFTTKSAYQIIKGTNIDKQYLVPHCLPQKIWIFHRHGTRLPSRSIIEKASRLEELRDAIVKNYRVLRTAPSTNALCQEDLIALQMWKWNNSITPDMEEYLTSQGYEDLRGTARHYQKLYPSVLLKEYNNTYYLFRHTDTQRTTESFKAFTDSLFGIHNDAVAEKLPEKDKLLRPYDYCEPWAANNNDDENSEVNKYKRSVLWNDTLMEISTRLGFQYTLESKDVELMYDICRYEQAWQVDRTSVWCGAFTPPQVTVFEYAEDLKYYYKFGYGSDINAHLNCRIVQNMIEHLGSNALPNVQVFFAHSAGLQTLMSALGINKDDRPLTANNYQSMSERKWKTSNIDPFAGNFVAVKYECNNAPMEKEKVIFFLNQNAVDLDWCHVGLCNWSEVVQRYEHIINTDCDSYYCPGVGALSAKPISIAVTLLMSAIIYLINLI